MRSKEYRINYPPIRWVETRERARYMESSYQMQRQRYELAILNAHGDDQPFKGPVHLEAIFYVKPHKLIRKRSPTDNDYGDPTTMSFVEALIKTISLAQIIWGNENQVSAITVQRHKDRYPRVFFRITEMP